MKRISFYSLAAVLAFVVSAVSIVAPCWGRTFKNPLFQGTDPWITYDNGTYYYLEDGCAVGMDICMKTSSTLTGIASAPFVNLFTAPSTGPNSAEVWAPELHKVNGIWYIYYAADDGDNNDHRLFVLQSTTSSPLGPYEMADTGATNGQIIESTGNWAIDPDVFTAADGNLYLTWSCTNSAQAVEPQNICIARMLDALHTTGNTVVISVPDHAWEQRGGSINEGPVGFVRNGATYITYSASATFVVDAYCVGLLKTTSMNILDPGPWTKDGPIFDAHGSSTYGPGSVVFVQSPDGTETWNVYHGWDDLQGNSKSIRMQKLYWGSDGTPVLGYPYDLSINMPVPSGENGFVGTGSTLADWGAAYGDAAEGNTTDGVKVGNWTTSGRNIANSTSLGLGSLGAGWHQIFSGWNPNYHNYSLNADLQWVQTGTTSSSPKYGVYAAYIDANNYYTIWIDIQNSVVATFGEAAGNTYGWANCPLPSGFVPGNFNRLIVDKVGSVFNMSINGTLLSGSCYGRSIPLANGQVGLATEDTKANYKNVSVTETY